MLLLPTVFVLVWIRLVLGFPCGQCPVALAVTPLGSSTAVGVQASVASGFSLPRVYDVSVPRIAVETLVHVHVPRKVVAPRVLLALVRIVSVLVVVRILGILLLFAYFASLFQQHELEASTDVSCVYD